MAINSHAAMKGKNKIRASPYFAAVLATALLAACTTPAPPLPTVPAVDLGRYSGTWYEIARLPNRFQAMCVSDTRATYQPDGKGVLVVNECRTADGRIEQATGVAKQVEGSDGAKLRVSFFRPFYGDYWILELDPDYRWVLVGEPGRNYAWVLAREPVLDEATLEKLLARATALGFERQAFLRTPHTRSPH
ncbi:MAG: lipocalin family protein [Thiobacillus sp.]|jgi:apolipoprotein D and lipocalin family protein|nr:lipocalin family protein [Thiobacillus sp.]